MNGYPKKGGHGGKFTWSGATIVASSPSSYTRRTRRDVGGPARCDGRRRFSTGWGRSPYPLALIVISRFVNLCNIWKTMAIGDN
ncbi:hypothetical protein HanIR_Chr08g0354631 [Helianthus annuus]|nr:hypothetical protein HanIR_Chr08g0354631 [Helianthus annuus]